MRKPVRRGLTSAAIGAAVFVLAIALFSRSGIAVEPQHSGGAPPAAAARGDSPRPGPAPQRRAPAPMVDYQRQIKPIISENCLECHSQDKRKGGLSLANYDDVLDGGKDGAVVR